MKMKKIALILLATSLVAVSCQKKNKKDLEPEQQATIQTQQPVVNHEKQYFVVMDSVVLGTQSVYKNDSLYTDGSWQSLQDSAGNVIGTTRYVLMKVAFNDTVKVVFTGSLSMKAKVKIWKTDSLYSTSSSTLITTQSVSNQNAWVFKYAVQ